MQTLEKFFDTRAAAPPYKPNALSGFGKMLNLPFNILKDFIQIMKLELYPSLAQQHQLKWSVQWCLRVPPSALPIIPIGMASVVVCKTRVLFFVSILKMHVCNLHYPKVNPSVSLSTQAGKPGIVCTWKNLELRGNFF